MLTAALHTLGGNRRLAEEAVQIAMVKAWRAAATFDPARPLAPWLYAIARRCAIDVGRQEQHHWLLPSDSPVGQAVASTGDDFESATAAWAVRDALDALPVREYKVMRLSYFEGLTQVEIAERLDIPVGTVKSRAASAHRRLRDELGPRLAVAARVRV
jgi:RNA polymerase sigma-70 factor (ECF subfamily)